MIETTALIGLAVTAFIGNFFSMFNKYELFNVAYCCTLLFIIFGRAFMTIYADKSIKESKRVLFESILYVVCTLLFIYKFLYFSGLCRNATGQIAPYLASILCVVLIKIYLFKSNIYGSMYSFWQVVDCVFVLFMIIIDLIITEETLVKYTNLLYSVSFSLLIALAFVNEHILFSLEYWIHKKAFIKTINMVAKEDLVEIIVPPTRNLETDRIYNKCVYILKYSQIRILETYRLMKLVREILLKNGYDKNTAELTAAYFYSNLIINLMRRKFDFYILPSKLIDYMYTLERKKQRKQ